MATPTTGSNTLKSIAATAQYVQEAWTREIEKPFSEALQAAKLVQDRSGYVTDGGDTLNIPFSIDVDARAKADNDTGITYDVPNGAPITMSIDKHYYSAVLIPDLTKVQSNYNLKTEFQARMAQSLAQQVDTDLLARWTDATNTVSGGATIDDADILAVIAYLDGTFTPQSERSGIIGAGTKGDLLGVNKYTAYDQTGKTGKAVDGTDGLVGTLYGMGIYMSQNVPTSTTGKNIFFHKKALSLAQQQAPKFEIEYSVDQIGTKCVLHTIYGVKTERPGSLVTLTRTTAP